MRSDIFWPNMAECGIIWRRTGRISIKTDVSSPPYIAEVPTSHFPTEILSCLTYDCPSRFVTALSPEKVSIEAKLEFVNFCVSATLHYTPVFNLQLKGSRVILWSFSFVTLWELCLFMANHWIAEASWMAPKVRIFQHWITWEEDFGCYAGPNLLCRNC